jgi:hypothetical protein
MAIAPFGFGAWYVFFKYSTFTRKMQEKNRCPLTEPEKSYIMVPLRILCDMSKIPFAEKIPKVSATQESPRSGGEKTG